MINEITDKYKIRINEKNCIIHLRLGDAFRECYAKLGYKPPDVSEIVKCVKKNVDQNYLIGLVYKPDAGGMSDEEYREMSNEYVKKLK